MKENHANIPVFSSSNYIAKKSKSSWPYYTIYKILLRNLSQIFIAVDFPFTRISPSTFSPSICASSLFSKHNNCLWFSKVTHHKEQLVCWYSGKPWQKINWYSRLRVDHRVIMPTLTNLTIVLKPKNFTFDMDFLYKNQNKLPILFFLTIIFL